ncbi:cysteine hydrolase [Bradyrhizobium sp. LHD-71]|uniref:cysteine hydrolase n=1 Tax=Bradyrhizobium sp. LHD-71 TaxID=3072141 RepID=UPI00280E28A1|nr:cysteine hydrolase [Bradyrhizobium sp. LHD-71]MDQ8730250.1 cysteine hydrolase [Bradyrhizobium sp. LHD-71]
MMPMLTFIVLIPAALRSSDAQAQSHMIDKNRAALVFVEFQDEWIGQNPVLTNELVKDKQGMVRATTAAANVLEAARVSGWNVVHAPLDLSNDPNYLLFGRGEEKLGLRAAIPRLKTWQASGSRFVAPFVPRENEFVLRGRSGASVLTNSTLDAYLRNNGIDTIILMGFATHVCIESTLRQAHDMGYNVYVVSDGVASFEPEQQAYFERHVLHHFGEGIASKKLIAQMRDGAARVGN